MSRDIPRVGFRQEGGVDTLHCDRDTSGVRLALAGWNSPQMEKLDRLHWMAGVSFTIFGVRIGVRANLPEFLDPLMLCVPVEWKPMCSSRVERVYSVIGVNAARSQKSAHRFNLLFGNSRQLVRTTNPNNLYEAFESDLDLYVGQETRNWLFVHAGVVGWKRWAVIIPGRSHSGKTTLVQALLEEGATYYSDEFAVFDPEGRVYPFPRRLSVRANAASERIAAAQLGAITGSRPLPVGLVVLTLYKPGTRWQPNVLSPGKGMLGLLQNTLSGRRHPELALQALGRAICRAHALGGTRGEAKETARLIIRHLERLTA